MNPIPQEELEKFLDLIVNAINARQSPNPPIDEAVLVIEWLETNAPEYYNKINQQ